MLLVDKYSSGKNAIVEALLKNPTIPNKEVAEIVADKGELMAFNQGDAIVRKGVFELFVYFVLDGWLVLHIDGMNASYQANEIFRISDLSKGLSHEEKTVFVVARADSVIVKFNREFLPAEAWCPVTTNAK